MLRGFPKVISLNKQKLKSFFKHLHTVRVFFGVFTRRYSNLSADRVNKSRCLCCKLCVYGNIKMFKTASTDCERYKNFKPNGRVRFDTNKYGLDRQTNSGAPFI